jgi:xanthine dehydrogenase accessory factor
MNQRKPIVVRGGGDLATGIIWQLSAAGFPVVILECGNPSAIRREAAFCEAVRLGRKTVEGIVCEKAGSAEEAAAKVSPLHPVLIVDEKAESLSVLKPDILIDAILAKRNLGTSRKMARLTVGVGPGFTAGEDVDYAVETMRGHNLGRVIRRGSALPNTGIPGIIAGYGAERVIHAPAEGIFRSLHRIGDLVEAGEPIGHIDAPDGSLRTDVPASLTGVLRGILPDGFAVPRGMKMADIDPRRNEQQNCFTISDKARCIAGSVLMLVCAFENDVLPSGDEKPDRSV